MRRGLRCSLTVFVALFSTGIARGEDLPRAGSPVDLAPFGTPIREASAIGVEWENPRDISSVEIAGAPAGVHLEWWGSVWPNTGSGGWMRLDDPWNGEWVRVKSEPRAGDGVQTFTFPVLAKEEWKNALEPEKYPGGKPPAWRRTLKVRVVSEAGGLEGAKLRVFGGSKWQEGRFDVHLTQREDGRGGGRIEVLNGILRGMEPLPGSTAARVEQNRWTSAGPGGAFSGVRLDLLYAGNPDRNSNDLTRVTVRVGPEERTTGFSFVPQDVMSEGPMRVEALGALVSDSAARLTPANDPGPGPDAWTKTVRQRITEEPEMTRAMAMKGIPRLHPPRWVPLGVPSARQEIFVSPNGDWSFWGMSINVEHPVISKRGTDNAKIMFRPRPEIRLADQFDVTLDTSEEPRFNGADREGVHRRLYEEHLPLIEVSWRTGPIVYRHEMIAATLTGEYADDVNRRGDETVVLLTRLEFTNTALEEHPAFVSIRYPYPAPLEVADDGIILIKPPADVKNPDGLTPTRGQVSTTPSGGDGSDWQASADDKQAVLRWRAMLKPGETRALYFKAPFTDLLDAGEMERLRQISFELETPRILDYWRERLAGGMLISVPEPALEQFYAANLWHNIITTDKDPETGLYNQGVGTVRYRVYANETVMIARSMDMRGEHAEAERFLDPMIRYQGHEPLTGRFSTKEGVLHSAGDYTHGEYAMNHGFVLWGVADHYFFTRDCEYLQRVAPNLVKGCDFLINERKSTMTDEGRRQGVYGLAPACALEDVVEFKYWLSTNSYYHLGMKKAAEALGDIGHPDAERLAREAEAYRRDIEAAAREATTRSAVVRLRNGRWVPYVPSRIDHWRHLTEGWIREALYCGLELAVGEVVSVDDPLTTWMLDELEDNVFFSAESGYGVKDVEKLWFSRGAVTLQPCLVDTPRIYMARDEIQAALRSFWNTYALSIYPDVHCFAEWAKAFGDGGGPVYKTSDESRFVMWLRQFLIWEHDGALWLGRAIPREWLQHGRTVRIERAATHFGGMDLAIHSETEGGRINALVNLPLRAAPTQTWLRLRHPEGRLPARVRINDALLARDRVIGEDILIADRDAKPGATLYIVAEYEPR